MAFRLLLVIPQFVLMLLLALTADVVVIPGWFAALVTGRLPHWTQRYLSAVVAYQTRVTAYFFLLFDRYPPFGLSFRAPGYPVRVELHPGRMNRLTVLFRGVLLIPVQIVVMVLGGGWNFCALVFWLIILTKGRVPEPVFGATVAMLRYTLRLNAYFLLLTQSYPRGLFGDTPVRSAAENPHSTDDSGTTASQPTGERGAPPLLLSGGARILLIVFLVAGTVSLVGQTTFNAYRTYQQVEHLRHTGQMRHR